LFDTKGEDGFYYDDLGGHYNEFSEYIPAPERAEEYYRLFEEAYGAEDGDGGYGAEAPYEDYDGEYDDEGNMEEYFSESDDEEEESKTQAGMVAKVTEVARVQFESYEGLANFDHIIPAYEWLRTQPAQVDGKDKRYTVRVVGVPAKCKEVHIEKLVRRHLKYAGIPQPPAGPEFAQHTKIIMMKDSEGFCTGEAWY
jgi:roadblock/LC7 domain-containing protein